MQKQKSARERVAARDKARTNTRLKKVGAKIGSGLGKGQPVLERAIKMRTKKKAPVKATPLNKKK